MTQAQTHREPFGTWLTTRQGHSHELVGMSKMMKYLSEKNWLTPEEYNELQHWFGEQVKEDS